VTKRRIIIIVNIVVLIAVAGLAFLIWPRVRKDSRAQEVPPTTTPFVISRDVAQGELVPVRFANLSFVSAGIVEEILVAAGDQVEVGSPLVKLNAGSQVSILDQAQARLAAAEIELQAAETDLAAARLDVTTAEVGVLAAEARLSAVSAGPSAEAVAAAQQKVEAARSGVAQANAGRNASLAVPESSIRSAEADVSAARAEVEELQHTYDQIINLCFDRPDGGTICPLYGTVEETTRAQLEAAHLRLESAQAALDTLNNGATSGQRQAAAGSVAIALAGQAMAEAQLDLLLAGPSAGEVRRVELQVAQARARVRQAQAAVARSQAAVSQAEVGVEIAQGDRDAAQTALERMTLHALFSGTVSSVKVKLGQLVSPGAPILALADLQDWLVETTDLSEFDIARVEIGAPVEVTVDALGGEKLKGEIIDIDRRFESKGGAVIYQATVGLQERRDLPLRWGMSVEVDYGSRP
jgi:multidrug resistance efflux pump